VKVDQVVLSRDPARALAEANALGLKRSPVETAVAYDGACISTPERPSSGFTSELLAAGVLVARPGAGFPGPVHLERFASPARLCVTDDPRLAGLGGAGMLTLVVPPAQLGAALATGSVTVRVPRTVQVSLVGRTRPFVCARDVALELLRRGVSDVVREVEARHGAPVVLEFTGPSVRALSVGERAVLAGLAPLLGAVAAVFVSDERTEVFLRDERRSKAHRALAPDPGAPCDDVATVDLAGVDPLVFDDGGHVRGVRDVAGKPVSQVVLGGDSGVTLRDLFAAAALLKSKRVAPRVDFLLAVPTRQMLEVLSTEGALADLVATGARLIEPDARLMTGDIYPPPRAHASLRSSDPEVRANRPPSFVASAETLAYAVASGEIGDPRAFKRPVRVTVPRALPTDDVLLLRERPLARRDVADVAAKNAPATPPAPMPWKPQTLDVVILGASPLASPSVVVCASLDELHEAVHRVVDTPEVRAIVATVFPRGLVSMVSGAGALALRVDAAGLKVARAAKTAQLPGLSGWDGPQTVAFGSAKVSCELLAVGVERAWIAAGTARPKR
jgi:aconitate hydratase